MNYNLSNLIIFDPLKDQEPKILKTKTKQVIDFNSEITKKVIMELNQTLDELIKTYGTTRGIGISAPQINSSQRISLIELDSKRYVLINPKLVYKSSTTELFRIGCFSFYEYRGLVRYPIKISIIYYNEVGSKKRLTVQGYFALIVQHELDHLDGILVYDRLPHKKKDLFIPREKKYGKKIPIKNYAFFIMFKRRFGFNQKIQSITQYYSLLFKDSVNYNEYILSAIKKRIELYNLLNTYPKGSKILEAGCGTSALSINLSKKYNVTAIDLNKDMLSLAKKMNTSFNGEVKYYSEDIFNMSFKSSSFDVVYSHGVLEHFDESDIIKAINEGLRVSKKYIISVPTIWDRSNNLLGDENLWTKRRWLNIISKSNGKIINVIPSFPFHPKLSKLNQRLGNRLSFIAPVLIFEVNRKD